MSHSLSPAADSAAPRPRWRRFLPDWLIVVSAACVVASFPPWDVTPLIWVALIPWFAAIQRAPTVKAAFFQGFWMNFLVTLGGFYWVAYVLKEFGELPWAVAILFMLCFCLVGQAQVLVLSPALKWLQIRGADRLDGKGSPWLAAVSGLAAAFLFAGVDWIIPKLFTDTWGDCFYRSRLVRQAADLGGPLLLSFLIVAANDALWKLIHRLRSRVEPSLWPPIAASLPQLALTAALLGGTLAYGHYRLEQVERIVGAAPRKLQAGVIQANIGDFDKVAAENGVSGAAEKVLQQFVELSDKALAMQPRPQFLVWPETSYPSTFRTPQTSDELAHDQQVERFVRDRKVPLLFGGYDHSNGKDFNALFFLSPEETEGDAQYAGGDLEVYRKNILLLFGEYIPGAERFDFIKKAFPQVGNFGRGEGPVALHVRTGDPATGTVLAGPVICYEVLFPSYVISEARKGAQLILNITNDSWFGPFGEPQLHLALASFRSVETRLPILRSTNTGISTLVTPDGEITHATPINQTAIMNVSIPVTPPIWTLMKAWGDWFGPASLFAALALWGFLLRSAVAVPAISAAPARPEIEPV